jgi:hypothetical protein
MFVASCDAVVANATSVEITPGGARVELQKWPRIGRVQKRRGQIDYVSYAYPELPVAQSGLLGRSVRSGGQSPHRCEQIILLKNARSPEII